MVGQAVPPAIPTRLRVVLAILALVLLPASVLEAAGPWSQESVEIDASLPKLGKHGRLRAIRRLLPLGRPQYQVLEIAGDPTIKQQVIVRYLTADVKASDMPASSVAITPANYKFHYEGSIEANHGGLDVYLITPRKKREGLIKGVVWIDAKTGVIVRQTGYLVKSPSLFVKRVNVTREVTLRDGVEEMRVTYLSIDTRIAGRAELVIHERPWEGE